MRFEESGGLGMNIRAFGRIYCLREQQGFSAQLAIDSMVIQLDLIRAIPSTNIHLNSRRTRMVMVKHFIP